MNVTISAFRCSDTGVSEAFVGSNWARHIAKNNNVNLITGDDQCNAMANVKVHYLSTRIGYFKKYFPTFMDEVKPDYLMFDMKAYLHCRALAQSADIYHHITPIAPRYFNSLAASARCFILGPVGGGLRVPPKFAHLEEKEPFYFRLRKLDRIRFRCDPFLRRTYKRAKVILVVGPYMRDIIPAEYHQKFRYMLETGVNPEDFSLVVRNDSRSRKIRLLYVGRIVPYKGLELLLMALGKIRKRYLANVQLDVVGDGQGYKDSCIRLASDLGIGDVVNFHGNRPKSETFSFYKEADIFCFPSLAETSGNALLEAMAMGLPTISIDYGGPSQIVAEGTGFVVKPLDPKYVSQEIADLLVRLVEDRNLRINIGTRAREHVLKRFSWEKKAQEMQTIYAEVVSH